MIQDIDEGPLSEPFWIPEGLAEEQAIRQFLRRRFAASFHILDRCLTEADPLDVAFPDNPGEYDDVVSEILVLLADVNADLRRVSAERLSSVVREGLARRFGEQPGAASLHKVIELLLERIRDLDHDPS